MGILMTIRGIAALGVERFIAAFDVTLLTIRLYMFSFKFISGIVRRCVIKEGRLPPFYVMA